MNTQNNFVLRGVPVFVRLIVMAVVLSLPYTSVAATFYQQDNLVSDIPGLADFVDPNLVNPWGIASSSTSPFWISDNHTGVSTLYNGAGQPAPVGSPLVVTIPSPVGTASPTGVVFNITGGFASAPFIFATEDGTIASWSGGTNAVLRYSSPSGAVYKGIAIGVSSSFANFLYATDFHNGSIAVFDTNFAPTSLAGAFMDPNLPAGYAPFNIQNIGGKLYVTYAVQDASKHDDVAGPGNGIVDVYDTDGNLLKRLISNGPLNSPWGMALAPAAFGEFSNALLIGNFGDGLINAFDPVAGNFLGHLLDGTGNPLTVEGLWGLRFGNGSQGFDRDFLYFTAGIPGGGSVEDHGLLGSIHVVSPVCRSAGFWGTHAGTECPKKQPTCGSQNITQDVITAAGGCLAVCGQEVTNTALNSANSAVEAICVSPSGDIELQLARQLTAATLNCVMSNFTATTSCSNGNCTTCGNLTIPGQDINIGTLVTACNDACIGSAATTTLGGVEVNCIDALNCFNNGGVFNAGTGPSTATCQTGTCSIDDSPCGIEGLPSCPTVIVVGIAQSQTCVPLPDNCESRPLCQVATPGNLTPGTPGLLCFDSLNADVECPQPPAAAPAICTPAPGPAGSANKCNSAIKNQCTLIEGSCGAGNGATCLTPVADIQVTKGVANAPSPVMCDNTLTYGPTAQGIDTGSCAVFCYKIVASNDGAETLTSVMVSDPDLPGLTVPSTLAPGQSATMFASKTWCAADAPAPNGHVNTVTANGVGTPSGIAVSAYASATVVVQGGNEACCYSDICGPNPGSCEERTSESCTSVGGLPQGPGTNCATTTCFLISTPQACCLPNGTCTWVAPDACGPTFGGTPKGCSTQCLGDSNGNSIDDICETP